MKNKLYTKNSSKYISKFDGFQNISFIDVLKWKFATRKEKIFQILN